MDAVAPWTPPGCPAEHRDRLVEVSRREWHDADSFDFGELEAFLTREGVCGADAGSVPRDAPVGAGVLLSGDLRPPAGARRGSRPSPVPAVPVACAIVYAAGPARERIDEPAARVETWTPSWTPAEHASAVSAVRDAIAAGDVYQVNIVGHQSASYSGRPAAAAYALGRLRRTPYSGSLCGADWSVISASPECLLEVAGGIARTRPIKGTVAASNAGTEDRRARDLLRASEKDRAEHVMIVDLARNDLGRVAVPGAVSVPELYAVRQLAGVWHAESTVRAQLVDDVGLASLLSAVFPGGSVTGAPKLAALAVIDRLEPVGRGPSMGAIGWIGSNGVVDLGLSIRTVAIADGHIHLWTGGGITWGSEPREEVAEAAVKAAPLLDALATLRR